MNAQLAETIAEAVVRGLGLLGQLWRARAARRAARLLATIRIDDELRRARHLAPRRQRLRWWAYQRARATAEAEGVDCKCLEADVEQRVIDAVAAALKRAGS